MLRAWLRPAESLNPRAANGKGHRVSPCGLCGCGGLPPIASATLLDGSVGPYLLLFSTEARYVRSALG